MKFFDRKFFLEILLTVPVFIAAWGICFVLGGVFGSFFGHIDEYSTFIGMFFGALFGVPAAFLAVGYLWRD